MKTNLARGDKHSRSKILTFQVINYLPHMLLLHVQVGKLQREVARQRKEYEDLLERRKVAEDDCRQVGSGFGLQDHEVEAKIEKARQSPQTVKFLQDVYFAHQEVQSKQRGLETTESEVMMYEDVEHNPRMQKRLKAQVYKHIIMLVDHETQIRTYGNTYLELPREYVCWSH